MQSPNFITRMMEEQIDFMSTVLISFYGFVSSCISIFDIDMGIMDVIIDMGIEVKKQPVCHRSFFARCLSHLNVYL